MHKSWRFIPSLKALTVVFAASAVLALCITSAFAQEGAGDAPGVVKKYVFMKSTGWGAAQSAAITRLGGTIDFSHARSGIGVVSSADPDFLRAALKSGAFDRGSTDMIVEWQKPSDVRIADESVVEDAAVNPGDDRLINLLWNMQAIDAFGAWSLGYDGAGARVAVIDGGMCSLHPDVAPNIDVAASRSFVAGFNWDQDTGGATSFRHACHVAGIIAAADNTIGTVGVAPRATIIGCKALHGGSGSFAAVIEAILYASDPIAAGGAGANIINMSLGATFAKGGGNTGAGPLVAAMNQAVNYATSNGVLVVSSAGNSGIDMDHSGSITNVPAQSGSGIAVSATAPMNWVGNPPGDFSAPTTYTNYGHQLVWVSAPGGDSAYPGNENCAAPLVSPPGVIVRPCWVFDLVLSPGSQSGSSFWAGGTSMAAPHVSGLAALLVSKYPGISVGDLKTAIKNSAVDAGANGADPFHGHGFINAYNAVTTPLAAQAASGTPKVESAAAVTRVELVIARNASGSVPEISFALPASGLARVDLFDIAGRRVAELYNGPANAGRTTLAWNGRTSSGDALGRGVYFARLTANGVQTSRTLLLLGQ